MNHPKPEEWVPYLYGQMKPNTRRQYKAHLKDCAECRGEVERWKRSVHRLEAWKLPRTQAVWPSVVPALRWAAAAAVVLGLGFGLGRVSSRAATAEFVRSRLEPQLRQELRQELAQMVHQEVSQASSTVLSASTDEAGKLLTTYNTIAETRRVQDLERLYLALKKQLDTVALNTEEGFVELAGHREPASDTSAP